MSGIENIRHSSEFEVGGKTRGCSVKGYVNVRIYDGVDSKSKMQPRDEFEWDEFNKDKLAARHGVDRYEAEEAATDPQAIIKRVGADRVGNPEFIFVGKTDDGRILFMVGVLKSLRRWRIGSARDAKFQEKRTYRRQSR